MEQENRDTFEQFVQNNKQDLKRCAPWVMLLSQNTNWKEAQQQVECAALLSSSVSPVGWFIGPANLMKEVVNKCLPNIQEQQTYDSQADNIDTLMQEFFYGVLSQQNVLYKSLSNKAVESVNEFVTSRGGQGWDQIQLIRILNHNLRIIRKKYNKENLPTQKEISIEYLYGIMLSYYGQQMIEEVPQIAVLTVTLPFVNGLQEIKIKELNQEGPLEIKRQRLLEKYEKMKNWKDKIVLNKDMSIQEIIEIFRKAVNEKTVGKAIRNKLNKLLKYVANEEFQRSVAYKEIKYTIRKDIKCLHLKEGQDYRNYEHMEKIFFVGMAQALNRLPTDIQVYNNQTLRNPRLHILYPFLSKLYPDLNKRDINEVKETIEEMKHMAQLIKRARKYGYFSSDWQNNLARQWSVLRGQVISYARKNKQENIQIPPPVQFDLALDLNPEAHPFSFTYGRVGGYVLDYENSQSTYEDCKNHNEKQYMYSIINNPPEKLYYLKAIPAEKVLKNQNDNDRKIAIDKFLQDLAQKDPENELLKKMDQYLQHRRGILPNFLIKKVDNNMGNAQKFTTFTLFDTIFWDYKTEDAFLDNVQVDLPAIKDQDAQRQKGGQNQDFAEGYGAEVKTIKNLAKGFSWGPDNYGGAGQYLGDYNDNDEEYSDDEMDEEEEEQKQ